MASVSFSVTRGTGEASFSNGGVTVTEGTSAPGAGDMEVRIDLTKNLTKREIKEKFDHIFRWLDDPNNTSTIPQI